MTEAQMLIKELMEDGTSLSAIARGVRIDIRNMQKMKRGEHVGRGPVLQLLTIFRNRPDVKKEFVR